MNLWLNLWLSGLCSYSLCCRLPDPETISVSCSVSVTGLHQLREEREKVKPLTPLEEDTFQRLVRWTTQGVEDDSVTFPPAMNGRHNLPQQDLKLCLDSLAKFVAKGFVYGPMDPASWPFRDFHSVGLFVREQKNSASCRVIYDCSSPKEPAGSAINDHNNPGFRLRFPYHMSQSSDLVLDIIDHGIGGVLVVLKDDLSDAFKNLGVEPAVYFKQCVLLCGTLWTDSRWALCLSHMK